jgi:hypothetical protein
VPRALLEESHPTTEQFRGDLAAVRCLLDSGAFSDLPERRLTAEQAPGRQLE